MEYTKSRTLISASSLTTIAPHAVYEVSFTRTQSRVVFIFLLTGHNTLRRYLHFMGLNNSPLFWRCGTEEETSAHVLCECEALSSFRHTYLGLLLGPRTLTI